jgi:serine phosphatase RsbU (regulator of sigma subunit)
MGVNAGEDCSTARTAEEATLALHQPDLDVDGVVGCLRGLIEGLGLATDAVFVPVDLPGNLYRQLDGEHAYEPQGHPARDSAAAEAFTVRGPDGRVHGTLRCLVASESARRELNLLAAHTGVALASLAQREQLARREEHVRRVAEDLQDALLPALPEMTRTVGAVRYRAATRDTRVGGDFYDVFTLPGGRVLITVGDVVGRGIKAATRTSQITQTLRALALQRFDLDSLLERVDQQVAFQDPEIMATMWCALYEPSTGALEYASLGHPPVLVLRSGEQPEFLDADGLPLGLRELGHAPADRRRITLAPGDLLVGYTDGIVEAHWDIAAGQRALSGAVLSRREQELEALVDGALDELLAAADHTDDTLVLALRRQ